MTSENNTLSPSENNKETKSHQNLSMEECNDEDKEDCEGLNTEKFSQSVDPGRVRFSSYSNASEGSQDSEAALLPDIGFTGGNHLMNASYPPYTSNSSPSRHNYREHQPLLGNYRASEFDDFNHWQGYYLFHL